MTAAQLGEIIISHAFDFTKYNNDIKSEVLTKECAEYIYSQYTELLNLYTNQQYGSCIGIYNTLEYSGYYVNYIALKRTKTINCIVDNEDGVEANTTDEV